MNRRQRRAGRRERKQSVLWRGGNVRTLLLNPVRRVNASVFLGLWGIFVLESTVSTPWTPPSAFVHNRSRGILPRLGQQAYNNNISQVPGVDQLASVAKSSDSTPSQGGAIRTIARALGIDHLFHRKSPRPSASTSPDPKKLRGTVVRTAARPRQASGGSVPSSRRYTTRKPSLPLIAVGDGGAAGDYNHYRTVALKSTPGRALSLLTRDVSAYIGTLDGGYFAKRGYRDGDLGENVLVEGVEFDFFRVGGRYRFSSQPEGTAEDVVIEVTEPMEPCPNLCKLPYIDDPAIQEPKEKLGRCQYFIAALGQKPGLRGWYARVVKGGVIRVGDMAALA